MDGTYFIKVGKCAKYYDNGQLEWELNYDANGAVIKEENSQYYKDGTEKIF